MFSRLAGYEDSNDAKRLSADPEETGTCSKRRPRRDYVSPFPLAGEPRAATPLPQVPLEAGFETEALTEPYHVHALMDLSGKWIDRVRERKPVRALIPDMDSSVSETYGAQKGTAYNGHFGCTWYHPLFCFNQFGDVERALLREGQVHSADDWHSVLEPVVARYRDENIRRFFCGDAAFANPDIYSFLEEEGYLYAIHLPANQNL